MMRTFGIMRNNNIIRYKSNMNVNKKPTKKEPKELKEPKEPKSWECCGDSCPNCVWTIYFQERMRYEINIINIKKLKGTLLS